ncbi:MAG: hypothetical protein AB8B48_18335 [Pseudomonadales bacterium]
MPRLSLVKTSLFAVTALLLLSACAQLVRPGYSTELVALKPGTYSIDPAHSTVLFKIDHFGLSKYIGLVGDEVALEIQAEFQKR